MKENYHDDIICLNDLKDYKTSSWYIRKGSGTNHLAGAGKEFTTTFPIVLGDHLNAPSPLIFKKNLK